MAPPHRAPPSRYLCLALTLLPLLSRALPLRIVTGTPAPTPSAGRAPAPIALRSPSPAGDGPLSHLSGRCFSLTQGGYVWSVCPFHNVSQRSVEGAHSPLHVLLGVWGGAWLAPLVPGSSYAQQSYPDGCTCVGARRRSAVVTLSCGEAHAVLDAREPTTCEYVLNMTAPEVCRAAAPVGGAVGLSVEGGTVSGAAVEVDAATGAAIAGASAGASGGAATSSGGASPAASAGGASPSASAGGASPAASARGASAAASAGGVSATTSAAASSTNPDGPSADAVRSAEEARADASGGASLADASFSSASADSTSAASPPLSGSAASPPLSGSPPASEPEGLLTAELVTRLAAVEAKLDTLLRLAQTERGGSAPGASMRSAASGSEQSTQPQQASWLLAKVPRLVIGSREDGDGAPGSEERVAGQAAETADRGGLVASGGKSPQVPWGEVPQVKSWL